MPLVNTRVNTVNSRLIRYLMRSPGNGMSPTSMRQREKAIALLVEESLLQATFTSHLVPVEAHDGRYISVGGKQLDAPLLIPDSGELSALYFAASTLGPRLEQRVTELFREKRASLALALDAIGNDLIFELGRRRHDRIIIDCRRKGLSVGQDLYAGDPGLDGSQQATVLHLAQAQTIGINLHNSGLLQPLKSSTVVFAVGHDLPEPKWNRCDHCPSRERCKLKQPKLDAA